MVNSPKIRHSKSVRDPVTIDLDAEPTKPADAAASPGDAIGPTRPDPVAAKPSDAPSLGREATSKPSSTTGPFGREAPGQADKATMAPDKPSTKAAPPQAPASAPRRGGVSAVAAGLIGGVFALAGAGALQYSGIFPVPGGQSSEIGTLRSELATLRQRVETAPADASTPRLDELAAAVDKTRADLDALRTGGTESPEAAAAIDERLKAVEASVAAAEQGGPTVDLAPVNQRLDALDKAVAAARQAAEGASAPLEQRIAAIEAKLNELGGKVAEQAEQPNAALAIAASSLKATIDRGEPFMTELETYASIAPQSTQVDSLRGMAAAGVPARTAIDDEFPQAANAMIAAAQSQDPNAGIIDRLMSSAQSLVQVRPVGMVEGEGAPAIVARMEVALHKGDYAGVVAEYDKLPDAAKAAGADFIAKVKARQAADGLIEAILSTALKA